MTSQWKKTASLAALLAASATMAAGVQAADLGGNCCTDLEERVAELEATTARKGNRKVSLQVYGQISQAIMFWDDGGESNTYVGENAFAKNRLGFRGSAKIDADITAGYKLEFEVKYNETAGFTQRSGGDNPNAIGAPLSLRHSALYLESKTYGAIWLGHSSTATSSIVDINLAGDVNDHLGGAGNNDWFGSFFLRSGTNAGDAGLSSLNWDNISAKFGAAWNPGGLSRRAVVRYVSPNFLGHTKSSGFNLQTSWGEDDVWDVALRYAEELGAFRVAAGIGYAWSSDADQRCSNLSSAGAGAVGGVGSGSAIAQSASNCSFLGGSVSVMHIPTGLYLTGAAAEVDDKNRDRLFARNVDNKDSFWYIQGGIEQKWFALGKTTLFIDYANNTAGQMIQNNGSIRTVGATDVINSMGATAQIAGTELTQWGVGITQAIDAAAMTMYLGYFNIEADVKLSNTTGTVVQKSRPIEDWSAVVMGATIKF